MRSARHRYPATLLTIWLVGCSSQFGDLGELGADGEDSTGADGGGDGEVPGLQWRVEVEHGAPIERICAVTPLAAGRLAVAGVSISESDPIDTGGVGWIRLYEATGELMADRALAADHTPVALDTDDEGNLFVVGSFGLEGEAGGSWMALYEPGGDRLWYRTRADAFRFSNCESRHDAVSLSDGYVASTAGLSHTIVTLDASGETVHELAIGDPAIGPHRIAAGSDDTYYAIASIAPATGADLRVVGRFDVSGQALWRRDTEGPAYVDIFSGLDAEVYVTDTEGHVIRHAVDGSPEWSAVFPDLNAWSPIFWAPDFVALDPFDSWALVSSSLPLDQPRAVDLALPIGYIPQSLGSGGDVALYIWGTHGDHAAWLAKYARE